MSDPRETLIQEAEQLIQKWDTAGWVGNITLMNVLRPLIADLKRGREDGQQERLVEVGLCGCEPIPDGKGGWTCRHVTAPPPTLQEPEK